MRVYVRIFAAKDKVKCKSIVNEDMCQTFMRNKWDNPYDSSVINGKVFQRLAVVVVAYFPKSPLWKFLLLYSWCNITSSFTILFLNFEYSMTQLHLMLFDCVLWSCHFFSSILVIIIELWYNYYIMRCTKRNYIA